MGGQLKGLKKKHQNLKKMNKTISSIPIPDRDMVWQDLADLAPQKEELAPTSDKVSGSSQTPTLSGAGDVEIEPPPHRRQVVTPKRCCVANTQSEAFKEDDGRP